jgi:hypothetical protein
VDPAHVPRARRPPDPRAGSGLRGVRGPAAGGDPQGVRRRADAPEGVERTRARPALLVARLCRIEASRPAPARSGGATSDPPDQPRDPGGARRPGPGRGRRPGDRRCLPVLRCALVLAARLADALRAAEDRLRRAVRGPAARPREGTRHALAERRAPERARQRDLRRRTLRVAGRARGRARTGCPRAARSRHRSAAGLPSRPWR